MENNKENDSFALPVEENNVEDAVFTEEFPYVDPDAEEARLREEFSAMQANMPQEDVAAYFFKMYYPVYVNLLQGLSNKDARRVAQHVIQFPLEDNNPHFHSKEAKEAFAVAIRLRDSYFIMKATQEMKRTAEFYEEKVKKEAEEKAAQETNTAEQPAIEGEINNG